MKECVPATPYSQAGMRGLRNDQPSQQWQRSVGSIQVVVTQSTSEERAGSAAPGNAKDQAEAGRASRSRSLKPLFELSPFLQNYRREMLWAGCALVVSTIATLAVPLGVRRMIDHGFSGGDGTFINRYFAMMVVVGLVLALASAARYYYVNWIGERLVADLRTSVFAHLSRLSPAFYELTHSGEVMSRLTADTTQIKAAIGTAATQFLRNALLLLGAVIMMIVTSFKLSILVLIAIPLIVFPLMAYGRAVRRLSAQAQDTIAQSSAYAAENLSAVRTMQAFTHESAAAERFARAVETAFQAALQRMRARAGLTALAIFLVFASVVGILWYGAHDVLAGSMTGGRLGQFVLYAVIAAAAMSGLSEVWGELLQAAGAAERLSELLSIEPVIKSPPDPLPLPRPVQGEVAFEHVTFVYPARPGELALDNVSFTVRPGERVAIVGPSGAGKSTIFSLLLRFYDPQSGQVLIDGVPINRLNLEELRRQIAYVPQNIALFADTVAENIRYGSPEASDEQVRAAAEAALADEFIRQLPGGYDAQLGEGGVMLSGGERQRIAIARAILRDAPILLLDEATSALDAESERLVQKALERVMEGRTTLVIAHRLATVLRADRIIVLDHGKIVEEGSHEVLVEQGGTYARLAALQFHSPAPVPPGAIDA